MDAAAARSALVDRLQREERIDRDSTARAMRTVPRHEFLPDHSVRHAYEDRPLKIGAGQTVSAPHMVARITDLLGLSPDDDVLEVGTGCGYHAAVTSRVVTEGSVVSVEYHEELARTARERFSRLDVPVRVRVADGHDGWPPAAPYDAAYLTCATASVPDALFDQLRPGGTLVAPVGTDRQTLVRFRHTGDEITRETHGPVRFVPMLGGE